MKNKKFSSLLKSKQFNVLCFILGNMGYAFGGFFSAFQEAKDNYPLSVVGALTTFTFAAIATKGFMGLIADDEKDKKNSIKKENSHANKEQGDNENLME